MDGMGKDAATSALASFTMLRRYYLAAFKAGKQRSHVAKGLPREWKDSHKGRAATCLTVSFPFRGIGRSSWRVRKQGKNNF